MISKKFFNFMLTFGLALQICNFSPALAMDDDNKDGGGTAVKFRGDPVAKNGETEDDTALVKPGTYVERHAVDTLRWGGVSEDEFGASLQKTKFQLKVGTGAIDFIYPLPQMDSRVSIVIPFSLNVVGGDVTFGLLRGSTQSVLTSMRVGPGNHAVLLVQADKVQGNKGPYTFFLKPEVGATTKQKPTSLTLSNFRVFVKDDPSFCTKTGTCISKYCCMFCNKCDCECFLGGLLAFGAVILCCPVWKACADCLPGCLDCVCREGGKCITCVCNDGICKCLGCICGALGNGCCQACMAICSIFKDCRC